MNNFNIPSSNLRRLQNYSLLNGSFSDRLGLMDGKSGILLSLLNSEENYLSKTVGVNFLQEVLQQINSSTPLMFGSGVAGIGVLIQWMNDRGFISQGPEELLEDFEINLFKLVFSGKLKQIDICAGLSGLGIYLFSRLSSFKALPTDKVSRFQFYRYQEALIAILFQIDEQLEKILKPGVYPISYWHGLAGVLLFVSKLDQIKISPETTKRIINLLQIEINERITKRPFSWDNLDAFFVLTLINPNNSTATLIEGNLGKMEKEACDFESLSLRAIQLSLISKKLNVVAFEELSKLLQTHLNKGLTDHKLADIFPFNPVENTVSLGIEKGISGTTLGLQSLLQRKFSWFEILGFEIYTSYEREN